MAKLIGGILGSVAGKASGLVFSSARAREGKVNTVRALVIPSNPNTADQQSQRTLFKRSLENCKLISPDIYQDAFNRAVNQLPGFQSLMSLILRNNDGSGVFTPPPDVSLGDLHFPDTLTIDAGSSAGEIDVTWSTENGSNGTAADKAYIFCYSSNASAAVKVKTSKGDSARSDGASGVTISGLTGEQEYIVGVYFSGEGTAAGSYSKAAFEAQVAAF